MVTTELKKDRIDAGAELITLLDKSGEHPDAALWFYDPELNSWKLVIVESKAGTQGPREAYRQLQKYITRLSPEHRNAFSLEDVSIAKPDSTLIQLLKAVVKTGAGISGIRFRNNIIKGTHIEDAYIYRLT